MDAEVTIARLRLRGNESAADSSTIGRPEDRMGYIERIPSTVNELFDSLTKLYENKNHVKSIHVNTTTSHLEVELDGAAHMFGGASGKDFYLPIKRPKLNEALELALKIWHGSTDPTVGQAQALFEMIDPQAK
jgi:hypothetical protein